MSITVFITGANRGIGLELARQYRARGERVIATARNPSEAAALVATGARVLALDVADPAQIDGLAAAVGTGGIDILINNAGVSSTSPTLESCTLEELQRVLTVNSISPVLVTKALLPNLRAGGRKVIINITSELASISTAKGSSYGYRASKAALNMLTVCMAQELKGFACIALHPGWVKTDMGGNRAPLTVEESVSSMLRVIDGVTAGSSGSYLNYAGKPIPW